MSLLISTDPQKVKWCYAVIDKCTGEPYTGFCICTAGAGEICSHVGALLFLATEVVAGGLDRLPDGPSCTEIPCQWAEPKGAKVGPVPLEEVELCDRNKESRTSVGKHEPVRVQTSSCTTYDRVMRLKNDLLNANINLPQPPIVHLLNMRRFRPYELRTVSPPKTLPDKGSDLNPDLVFFCELTTETTPMPIPEMPHMQFHSTNTQGYIREKIRFMNDCKLTPLERIKISQITMGQGNNREWLEQRKGSITSTKFKRVVSFVNNGKSSPDNLVSDILGYKSQTFKSAAMEWGTQHESTAINKYIQIHSKDKCKLDVLPQGLIVHQNYAYIRASPDGVVVCDCGNCPKKLIEVKCPHKQRHMSPEEAIQKKEINYISFDAESGVYNLVKNHQRGYFEQVTVQMACTKVNQIDFVIWTRKGLLVIPVEFDETYWVGSLLPAAQTFYSQFLVPEILTSSIKLKLKPDTLNVSSSGNDSSSGESVSDIDDTSASISSVDEQYMAAPVMNVKNQIVDSPPNGPSVLACAKYCKDKRAPNYSRVKGQMIACDVNLNCVANSSYHLFCEGFRRLPPQMIDKSCIYICTQCRVDHENADMLELSHGFLQSNVIP